MCEVVLFINVQNIMGHPALKPIDENFLLVEFRILSWTFKNAYKRVHCHLSSVCMLHVNIMLHSSTAT